MRLSRFDSIKEEDIVSCGCSEVLQPASAHICWQRVPSLVDKAHSVLGQFNHFWLRLALGLLAREAFSAFVHALSGTSVTPSTVQNKKVALSSSTKIPRSGTALSNFLITFEGLEKTACSAHSNYYFTICTYYARKNVCSLRLLSDWPFKPWIWQIWPNYDM